MPQTSSLTALSFRVGETEAQERSELPNMVVMCLLLGTFPVSKLPPSGVGGEEVKWALSWKPVKDLPLLPFSLPLTM